MGRSSYLCVYFLVKLKKNHCEVWLHICHLCKIVVSMSLCSEDLVLEMGVSLWIIIFTNQRKRIVFSGSDVDKISRIVWIWEFCNNSQEGKRTPLAQLCLQSRSPESLFLSTCNAAKLAKQLIVLPIACNRSWKLLYMVLHKASSSSG